MNEIAMRQLLLACLFAVTGFAHAEVIDIDNAQLEKLNKSGVPVIDIRLQSEWEETGIVICRSGNRTKAVSQFLSQQGGYTTVYNVKSGIKGWIGAGGAVVPATPTIASCKATKTC